MRTSQRPGDLAPPPSVTEARKPAYRLYSVAALDIATFAGSILAGYLLMAQNLRAAGDGEGARREATLGLLLLLAMMSLLLFVPATESIPDLVFQGVQVWVVHVYASRTQSGLLAAHQHAGGGFHSRWRGFGLGLAVGAVAVGAIFVFYFLAPEGWLPE